MSKAEQFDAIVIGTGQAGPALAVRLAQSGKKVAILERKLFGGTCVNVGCVPSKTLIASARAAHVARQGSAYGVMIDGPIRVDMERVKARKDAVVRQSNEGVSTWLTTTPNLTVIEGHGRFVDDHSIEVNGRTLQAAQIFINVGGRPSVPPIPGLQDATFLTSSSIMELDQLPTHLVIVGGSYIGLEFAQMYRRFGSEVTVVEAAPQLIGREDVAVSTAVQAILVKEGVKIDVNAKELRVTTTDAGTTVHLTIDGAAKALSASHLLIAVGRVPNTDDLGLEHTGIKKDERGFIIVDDTLVTSVPGIYALGDVNGRGAFTHTAYNDFEIVAANLLDKDSRRVSDRIAAYALYIDPPLARVGLSEREARASGRPILSSTIQMARVGRARERGETTGFMQVLVDADTKKILGATLLGIEADEVIHALVDVMYADAPYTVIQRAMHIHPTVSELIPTLLSGLKPLE